MINILLKCTNNYIAFSVDGKNVTDLKCDSKTGEYKYAIGGPEMTVDKETKFECNCEFDENTII